MREAARHPRNRRRETFAEEGGVTGNEITRLRADGEIARPLAAGLPPQNIERMT
jgi:hypothetical protein